MGFSHNMVAKAIQEHGLEDADSILETLLLYNALESSPPEQHSLPELHSPLQQCSPQMIQIMIQCEASPSCLSLIFYWDYLQASIMFSMLWSSSSSKLSSNPHCISFIACCLCCSSFCSKS